MVQEILKTKITPPVVGSNMIIRQRLINELKRGLKIKDGFTRKLTLITAPAGFGKTSLVTHYCQKTERDVCWLSLSKEDNSPYSLLRYLLAAIKEVKTEFKATTKNILDGLAADITKTNKEKLEPKLIITFLNQLTELKEPIYIILDELEKINAKEVHEFLIYLIDNLPSKVHIMTTTRKDPPWPIIRWRGRGKAKIIEQQELKFNDTEAKQFLQQQNLELSDKEVK